MMSIGMPYSIANVANVCLAQCVVRLILLDIAQVGNLFQIAIDWSNPVEKQIITDAP